LSWIEGNSIASLVEVVIKTKETFFWIVTKTGSGTGLSRKRVVHMSDWRVVAARSLPPAVTPNQPFVSTVLEPGTSTSLRSVCTADAGHIAVQPFVSGIMSRDRVDNPTDRAASVE